MRKNISENMKRRALDLLVLAAEMTVMSGIVYWYLHRDIKPSQLQPTQPEQSISQPAQQTQEARGNYNDGKSNLVYANGKTSKFQATYLPEYALHQNSGSTGKEEEKEEKRRKVK